jgi:hypothetical protein
VLVVGADAVDVAVVVLAGALDEVLVVLGAWELAAAGRAELEEEPEPPQPPITAAAVSVSAMSEIRMVVCLTCSRPDRRAPAERRGSIQP